MIHKIKNEITDNNHKFINNNQNSQNNSNNVNNNPNNNMETLNLESITMNSNTNVITQEQVMDSINQNFAINQNYTNNFNQALYESVKNDLSSYLNGGQ